jgi:SNF2 family DNA or RNA helicase
MAKRDSHLNLLKSSPWDAIICDEADNYTSVTARRTVALFGRAIESLWQYARYVWPLTGTPIVNSAADLYPIMSSTLAKRLGALPSYDAFCNRYCMMVRNSFTHAMEPKSGVLQNGEELWAVLRPHMLARRGILNLPPLTVTTYPVEVSQESLDEITADLHRAMLASAFTEEQVERIVADALDDPAISRVRHALGLAKVSQAAVYTEYLVKSGAGPVVVYYLHRDVKDAAFAQLSDKKLRVAYIDGSNSGVSQPIQDAFQAGQLDVLLLQIQAGGAGITLTRANRGVMVEQPWTARAMEQAVKRMSRIGQKRPVLVEVLFASGCWLDELTSRLIAQKAQMSGIVLGHST